MITYTRTHEDGTVSAWQCGRARNVNIPVDPGLSSEQNEARAAAKYLDHEDFRVICHSMYGNVRLWRSPAVPH